MAPCRGSCSASRGARCRRRRRRPLDIRAGRRFRCRQPSGAVAPACIREGPDRRGELRARRLAEVDGEASRRGPVNVVRMARPGEGGQLGVLRQFGVAIDRAGVPLNDAETGSGNLRIRMRTVTTRFCQRYNSCLPENSLIPRFPASVSAVPAHPPANGMARSQSGSAARTQNRRFGT